MSNFGSDMRCRTHLLIKSVETNYIYLSTQTLFQMPVFCTSNVFLSLSSSLHDCKLASYVLSMQMPWAVADVSVTPLCVSVSSTGLGRHPCNDRW